MEPLLHDGDEILVDRAQRALRDGIHVVRVGDALLVKRLAAAGPGRATLLSVNPVYPPFDVTLDLNLRLSYLAKFSIKGVDYVGTYPAPGTFVDGFTNFPRWRGSGQIGYSAGRFSIQWTTNFVDRMNDFFVGTTVPVDNALSYSGTPRYFSHDLLLRVADVADSTFTLGVNNLTDKKPPYAFITTKNTLTSAYDVIGRYFFMSVSHKF